MFCGEIVIYHFSSPPLHTSMNHYHNNNISFYLIYFSLHFVYAFKNISPSPPLPPLFVSIVIIVVYEYSTRIACVYVCNDPCPLLQYSTRFCSPTLFRFLISHITLGMRGFKMFIMLESRVQAYFRFLFNTNRCQLATQLHNQPNCVHERIWGYAMNTVRFGIVRTFIEHKYRVADERIITINRHSTLRNEPSRHLFETTCCIY